MERSPRFECCSGRDREAHGMKEHDEGGKNDLFKGGAMNGKNKLERYLTCFVCGGNHYARDSNWKACYVVEVVEDDDGELRMGALRILNAL